MLPEPPESGHALTRYVEAAGESLNVDAKAPMEWDGGEGCAGLAKDIMAMANTPNGGALVIGKTEVSPGEFRFVGLTEEQAGSFETTKVASWVNARCGPSVRLVCSRTHSHDKAFVVIIVQQFDDVPVMCTRDYLHEPGGKPILSSGTMYVRTANAESAPLRDVENLRRLIGVAVQVKGDGLLKTLEAALRGRPPLPAEGAPDPYETELSEVAEAAVGGLLADPRSSGWHLICRPVELVPDRWSEEQAQERLLFDRLHVGVIQFPRSQGEQGLRAMPCGWLYHYVKEQVLYVGRSGLVVWTAPFREDAEAFQSHWRGESPIPEKQWLNYPWLLMTIFGFFGFISRVARHYADDEALVCQVQANGLSQRFLVDPQAILCILDDDPCLAKQFAYSVTVPAAAVRATWDTIAAEATQRMLRLFLHRAVPSETLAKFAEQFRGEAGL